MPPHGHSLPDSGLVYGIKRGGREEEEEEERRENKRREREMGSK